MPYDTEVPLPPHSNDAEQSVLGALLLDNPGLDRIADLLQDSDFYVAAHAEIYRAIVALIGAGQPADVVTVAESLAASGRLQGVGDLAYLGALAQAVPTSAHLRRYAEIVRERADLRQLAGVGQRIVESVYAPAGRSTAEIVDAAERLVLGVGERSLRTSPGQNIQPLLADAIERLEERFRSDRKLVGRTTGLADLDERTQGLKPGNLILVAGRPAMGKTALAMNIAEAISLQEQAPIAVFTMEMSREEITDRVICQTARVDSQRFQDGRLDDDGWACVSASVGRWNAARLKIDDTPALTPSELRARARRYHREFGSLGLIVIDYVQLMRADERYPNQHEALASISSAIKALAKELRVPVLALSQLNREVDSRANKRPLMSDLRGSGAFEQDADLILLLYRDEVYNPDTPDRGIAEIIIAKQRSGPTGTIRAAFRGECTRFDSLARTGWTPT